MELYLIKTKINNKFQNLRGMIAKQIVKNKPELKSKMKLALTLSEAAKPKFLR